MPNSITGIFSQNDQLHDKALESLNNVSFQENNVTFSIERIKYSPISQKQFVHKESLFVVFIGTLLNFEKLREHLAIDVEHDVELVAHMYSVNTDLFNHLQGLFTTVIYDIRKKLCLVIQDRLSSPLNLYYRVDEDGIVFSTSLKKLLPLVKTERKLDYRSVITFIERQFVPSKHTLVMEVHKLLPGEYLKIRNGTNIEANVVKHKISREKRPPVDSCSEYNKIIESSVKSCFKTLGEKNIGLSSGYDSNAILQIARRMDNNSINAFTVGGEIGRNETDAVSEILSNYDNITLYRSALDAQAFLDLPDIVFRLEGCFCGQADFVRYHVYRMVVEKGCKTIVGGDGCDEILMKYESFKSTIREMLKTIPVVSQVLLYMKGKPYWCLPYSPDRQAFFLNINRRNAMKMLKRAGILSNSFSLESQFPYLHPNFENLASSMRKKNKEKKIVHKRCIMQMLPEKARENIEHLGGGIDVNEFMYPEYESLVIEFLRKSTLEDRLGTRFFDYLSRDINFMIRALYIELFNKTFLSGKYDKDLSEESFDRKLNEMIRE